MMRRDSPLIIRLPQLSELSDTPLEWFVSGALRAAVRVFPHGFARTHYQLINLAHFEAA